MIKTKPEAWNLNRGLVDPKWGQFWTHVDSDTLIATLFSSYLDSNTNQLGAITGAAPDAFSLAGRGVNFANAQNALGFVHTFAVADVDITFAMVIEFTDMGRSRILVTNSVGANQGMRMSLDSNSPGLLRFTKSGSVDKTSSLGVTTAPWFVAISYRASDGNINFCTKNMATKALSTEVQSDSSAVATPDVNTWGFGHSFNSKSPGGIVSLGFLTLSYMPMEQLVEWAQDPFGPFEMDLRRLGKASAAVAASFPPVIPHFYRSPQLRM